MTMRRKLLLMNNKFADLGPRQREFALDFMLGFCAGYVPDDKWLRFLEETYDVACKTSEKGGQKAAPEAVPQAAPTQAAPPLLDRKRVAGNEREEG